MIHNGVEIDGAVYNGTEISDALRNGETLFSLSVLRNMGITEADVAYFTSRRKGRAGQGGTITVRRTSDSTAHNIPIRPGAPKNRKANLVINPDGRYGTIGWSAANGGVVAAATGGVSTVGVAGYNYIRIHLARSSSTMFIKPSATKRLYFRCLVYVPANISTLRLRAYNGTATFESDVFSQVTPGGNSWVHGIMTMASAGTGITCYVNFGFADTAAALGATCAVRYATIVDMGDSVADSLYSKTTAEMYTWMQTQPSVQRAVDGSPYLLPYGLCPGELDLDTAVSVGGASQLYDAVVDQQDVHILELTQACLNGSFENDLEGWGVPIGPGLVEVSSARAFKGAKAAHFVLNAQSGSLSKDIAFPNGHSIYVCAMGYLESGSLSSSNAFLTVYDYGTTSNGASLDSLVQGQWVFKSMIKTSANGGIRITPGRGSANTAEFYIDSVIAIDLTPVAEAGVINQAEIDAILSIISDYPYWEGTKPIDCSLAFTTIQLSADNQPLLYDAGLWYPFGEFDGSNDYMLADLPDIIHGPCTWWIQENIASANSWSFCRMGSGDTEVQYSIRNDISDSKLYLGVTGAYNKVGLALEINRDALYAFVWDGSNITPYKVIDGVVIAGSPVAFTGTLTSYPNKLIGCRPTAADGSTRTGYLSGGIHEIGIVTVALTQDQIQKLWR